MASQDTGAEPRSPQHDSPAAEQMVGPHSPQHDTPISEHDTGAGPHSPDDNTPASEQVVRQRTRASQIDRNKATPRVVRRSSQHRQQHPPLQPRVLPTLVPNAIMYSTSRGNMDFSMLVPQLHHRDNLSHAGLGALPPGIVSNMSQLSSQQPSFSRDDSSNYWEPRELDTLIQYLGSPGKYDQWKGAGTRRIGGSQGACTMTKKKVCQLISTYLFSHGVRRDHDQVKNKMIYLEKKYRAARDFLTNAGEDHSGDDKKMGVRAIRENVLRLCPVFEKLDPFMSDNPCNNPPHVGDTGTDDDLHDLPVQSDASMRTDLEIRSHNTRPSGVNDAQTESKVFAGGFLDAPPGEADFVPSDDDIAIDSASRPTASFGRGANRPSITTPACGQGLNDTPAQVTPTPTSILGGQSQEVPQPPHYVPSGKKRKKDIFYALVEMQEQHRAQQQKKMELRAEHQSEVLKLRRKEAANLFALENRRLDLEFKRMEQQKEELKLREMTLQFELEKLRKHSSS